MRQRIHRLALTLATSLLALWVGFGAAAADKPNIVLIISDDHHYGDYGFMGHEVVQTPNLDKLASQSALF